MIARPGEKKPLGVIRAMARSYGERATTINYNADCKVHGAKCKAWATPPKAWADHLLRQTLIRDLVDWVSKADSGIDAVGHRRLGEDIAIKFGHVPKSGKSN